MTPDDPNAPDPEGPYDGQEPSYYEIALTHRQVLAAFVVLLGSVVAAFFAGVWIGREGRLLPDADRPAATATTAENGKGQKLDQFDFFSDTPAVKKEPAVAEQKPGSTLLDDLGGDRDAASPPGGPAAESGEEGPAGATTTDSAETAPSSTPGTGATPAAPAPAPAPAPPSRAVTVAPAVVSPNQVFIQVFSSSDEAQAKKITQRLTGAGVAAFLSPVRVGTVTMYRVRVGPFKNDGEARPLAERIRKKFKLDTWITK